MQHTEIETDTQPYISAFIYYGVVRPCIPHQYSASRGIHRLGVLLFAAWRVVPTRPNA